MGQLHDSTQGAITAPQRGELGQLCRNLVTVAPFRQVPIGTPEAEPQGNAIMSVRITAAGAVAIASLAFLTAPVSACDERFIKKCERASAAAAAAAAAAAQAQDAAPLAKRKSVKRVQVVASRRSKHTRFAKRTRAPGFAVKREVGMTLASASSRATLLPESALARRFRGFIDPRPIAQNAFEIWRKPHVMAVNLEPPETVPAAEAAPPPPAAETPVQSAASPAATAKQDRIGPKPAVMELSSAEPRPVILPELPIHSSPIAPSNVPAPAIQAVLSEVPAAPIEQPGRFSFPQLFLALCGALGAASALRFVVGA